VLKEREMGKLFEEMEMEEGVVWFWLLFLWW
jgi:hypothetical protein